MAQLFGETHGTATARQCSAKKSTAWQRDAKASLRGTRRGLATAWIRHDTKCIAMARRSKDTQRHSKALTRNGKARYASLISAKAMNCRTEKGRPEQSRGLDRHVQARRSDGTAQAWQGNELQRDDCTATAWLRKVQRWHGIATDAMTRKAMAWQSRHGLAAE